MRIPSSGLYKNQSICNIKQEFRQPEELSSTQAVKYEERRNEAAAILKNGFNFFNTYVDLLHLSYHI